MGLLKKLFQVPRYSRFVLLVSSKRGSLWDYAVWTERAFAPLDRLLESLGCTSPSVQCRQITKNQSNEIKFGRIEWSPKDAAIWCHDSQQTKGKFHEWLFVDLQIHCPPKEELVKAVEFPTIYVQVKPMAWEGVPSKALYDQAVHVAIRRDAYQKAASAGDRVRELAEAVDAVAVYSGSSRVSSLNSFESLLREDFQYKGILEDGLPDERRMKGNWSREAVKISTR